MVDALKANASLTFLDVRRVSKMAVEFEAIGELLLRPNSVCRLAYLRCDSFELLEDVTSLSLRETRLDKGAAQLLTGLLKNNNRTLRELDLGATGFEKAWADNLVAALSTNPALKVIHLPYNPAIDPESQDAILASVKERNLRVAIDF